MSCALCTVKNLKEGRFSAKNWCYFWGRIVILRETALQHVCVCGWWFYIHLFFIIVVLMMRVRVIYSRKMCFHSFQHFAPHTLDHIFRIPGLSRYTTLCRYVGSHNVYSLDYIIWIKKKREMRQQQKRVYAPISHFKLDK